MPALLSTILDIIYMHKIKSAPWPNVSQVGDRRLRITDEEHETRAMQVELQLLDAKEAGCSGVSVIPEELPYVSYNNLWLFPVCHALLFGV